MKFQALLIATSFFCTAYAAEELPPVTQVIPFTEMDAERSSAFLMGGLPDVAIECKAGTQLPLKYLVNFKLFSLQALPTVKLNIDQTFYVRSVNHKGYISYDLKEWEKASSVIGGKMAHPKIEVDPSALSIEVNFEEGYADEELAE